jgi:glycosyltransferase involved in cell wall biosynthesis
MSVQAIAFSARPEPGLVSVVIPTYNRAHILRTAVDSALNQTYPHIEVVVVDDGSVDDTRDLVATMDPRVRYFKQANGGVAAARNHGMLEARGEFIAFLDSDDEWLPWKITAQVGALRRCPRATIAWTDMTSVCGAEMIRERHLRVMYSAYEFSDLDNTLARIAPLGEFSPDIPARWRNAPVRTGDISSAIMLGNLLHTSTVVFRRDALIQSGGFDETYRPAGEDYEFYVRLTLTGDVVLLDAPSTIYRIGEADQLTHPAMMLEMAANNLRTLRDWLPPRSTRLTLSPNLVRRRVSDSIDWLAQTELDAGFNWIAARHFMESLATRPAIDQRAAWLLACAMPRGVRQTLAAVRRRVRPSPSATKSRQLTASRF